MIRHPLLGLAGGLFFAASSPATAHQFNVFATTDCVTITVMATLESGRPPETGLVLLRNDQHEVVATQDLGSTGTTDIPLAGLDVSSGITAEVFSGDHGDYWVLTPDDMARRCAS
jgi:nickel transport protein